MTRIESIRKIIDELNLDAVYITHIPNIRYITGFSGSSAYVIITRNKNIFITDFRYKEQSHAQVKDFEIIVKAASAEEVKKVFESEGLKNIGFESSHITVHQLDDLKVSSKDVVFTPLGERIERLTMIKTSDEIARIQKAADISDLVFNKLLEIIKPGLKEMDVSAEISYWHKKFGASRDSFDPIVASGWRGCLPHGMASDKVIGNGEMVTLDFGCVYDGFCSDITRTISVGNPTEEMKKVYEVVLKSQQLALDAAKAGISSKELDMISRKYIYDSGYEGKFGHGLGHGLGIEVHEIPSVSQRMEMILPENAVVTIEPGIYLENVGGVRIEDDILIQKNGCLIFNKAPKELIIL
ncbi:MAG: aminopeptidase P family protein [Ignavibacteria bacterium]|nr:aminopeptidase P family protein [Ignavibacteria bacterium]